MPLPFPFHRMPQSLQLLPNAPYRKTKPRLSCVPAAPSPCVPLLCNAAAARAKPELRPPAAPSFRHLFGSPKQVDITHYDAKVHAFHQSLSASRRRSAIATRSSCAAARSRASPTGRFAGQETLEPSRRYPVLHVVEPLPARQVVIVSLPTGRAPPVMPMLSPGRLRP
jgi:hypothetical protein